MQPNITQLQLKKLSRVDLFNILQVSAINVFFSNFFLFSGYEALFDHRFEVKAQF